MDTNMTHVDAGDLIENADPEMVKTQARIAELEGREQELKKALINMESAMFYMLVDGDTLARLEGKQAQRETRALLSRLYSEKVQSEGLEGCRIVHIQPLTD